MCTLVVNHRSTPFLNLDYKCKHYLKVLYFVESAAYIRAKLLAKSSTRPTRAGFKSALLFAKHTKIPWTCQC